jgi:hypothetical protein
LSCFSENSQPNLFAIAKKHKIKLALKSIELLKESELWKILLPMLFVGHKNCSLFALKRKHRKRAAFIG